VTVLILLFFFSQMVRNANRAAQRIAWRRQLDDYERVLMFARANRLSNVVMRNVWSKVRALRLKLDRNVDRQVPQMIVSSTSSAGSSSSSSTSSDDSDGVNQHSDSLHQPNQVVLVS
jgi:hypothetical protein